MQKAFGQAQELKRHWETVYTGAANNPASWQRQLPRALKTLIDDSLDSLEFWVGQLSTRNTLPHGEQITESVASEFLPQLMVSLKELEAGNHSQLNHFINELSHLMTVIHTMPIHLKSKQNTTTFSQRH